MSDLVVDVNGVAISAALSDQGVIFISEDAALVEAANLAVRTGEGVPLVKGLPGKLFPAGDESPLELIAAMFSSDPEHSHIVSAPASVHDVISSYIAVNPNQTTITL